MPAISTNGTVLTRLAGALYNTQMSNATYKEVAALDPSALADALYARDFSSATDATVATTLVTNLGLTSVEGLANWVAAQLTAAGSHKGAKVVELLNGFAQMSADATYGTAATAFNTKVDAALALSQTDGNKGGTFAAAGTTATTGGTFTLTAGTDLADAAGSSSGGVVKSFAFTSFNDTVNGSLGTFASADSILDDSTTDSDSATVSVNATVAATIANIENLNLKMAAGSPVVQFTNVSGTKAVNVTGTVNGELDELDSDVVTAVTVNDYAKTLTITAESFGGTATSSPESFTVNVNNVSGTSAGITLAADSAGAIETFGLGISGSNSFTLAASGGLTATTISGAGSANIKVANALITGATVNNTATGAVTIDIDRATIGSAATNLYSVTGVNNWVFRNADADNSEDLVVTGVTSGSTITVADDFANASSIVVTGSASSTADSLTINLDNRSTTANDVDFSGSLTVDEVETLVINSVEAGATTATATNTITTLNADKATTITINATAKFATAIAAEDQGMTINASASTAAVTVDASAITKSTAVLNNVITGGSANDTLTGATTEANTISGGAGNDTISITDSSSNVAANLSGGEGNDSITGGRGNDTVDGGEGNDLITVTSGADTVTGGTGYDTFDVNSTDVAAVAQVNTITPVSTNAIYLAGETITVNIDGVARAYALTAADVAGTASTDDILLISASLVNFINANFTQVTATNVAATGVITVTAGTAGTPFTLVVTDSSADAESDYTEAATTTVNVAAIVMDTTITDFAAGDVLNLANVNDGSALGTTGYFEGATADAADTLANTFIVLTDAGFASADAAETAVDDGGSTTTGDSIVVFLNTTLGYAQAYYDDDTDTASTEEVLINFTGITTLTQLAAAFSSDSVVLS